MAKTNNYSYKVNDGRRHGAFNIYQAKTGAIMLLMANSYTPLTLKQVNDLTINVFNLIDFEYEDFKKFYNQKAVEEKSLIMADINKPLESTDTKALVIHSVSHSFFNDKELNHIRQWFNTTIDQNQDKDIKKTEWELALKIHTKLNIRPENRIVKNCG